MLIYKKMGFFSDMKSKIMGPSQAQAQEGGRSRKRRRGRKCRGGDEFSGDDTTAVGMEGGRRRRGRKSRKSRRGTRKHTRRHRR
jgi:hypothetical protein